MKRLSVGVLGLVVASTGIVGCAGLVAGSALAILKLKTISLPGGALQQPYSASVSVTGGRPPYVWGIISGQLPPGLALSTVSGGISGTPLQTGTFTFSVQVKDSTGHSDSSAYSLNIASVPAVNPAPIISGASPNSGPTSGGTAVTISGTNFQTGATVLFGGVGAVPVTILSSTQIQVMTPTHIAGTVDVTVRNPDGQSATLSSGFTYTAPPPANPPSITGISPNSGPTSGGTAVTISGTNFQTGATVLFGGVGAVPVTILSSTQIQVVTPTHVAGPVDVTVRNLDGQSATLSSGFMYTLVSPTLGGISPNTGPAAGGTSVSISGSNFLAGALVLFGTASAPTVTVNSATQIQAVTPANAAGLADVTVQNPNGQSGIMTGGFTYTAPPVGPPSITSISPNSGAPGTQVTINGTNFASGATLSFGTVNASSVTFVSSTQLTVGVPAQSPGVVDVKVTNPGGSAATLPGGFTVTTAQSLLAGMTPANFTVPPGWTSVTTQDFEGTIPSSQSFFGTVTSSFSHSGTKSLSQTIDYDAAAAQWFLNEGGLGSWNDVYASYWDYGNGAQFNEEYVLFDTLKHIGSNFIEVGFSLGYLGTGCCGGGFSFNAPNGTFQGAIQGLTSVPFNGPTITGYGGSGWNQWEVWLHRNSSGNADGFLQVYRNGQRVWNLQNMNWFGTQDATGDQISLGGWYTKNVWTNNGLRPNAGGTCSIAAGLGSESGPWLGSFSTVGAANCPPAPPIFKRYIDDIIVLKK